MASPIILCFDRTGSFTSMDSFSYGAAGITAGSVTLPFTPLLFTPDRIRAGLGPESGYITGTLPLNNEYFYEKAYSPLHSIQQNFWGETVAIKKNVCGIVIGVDAGKSLSSAKGAYDKTVGWLATKALRKYSAVEIIGHKITDLINKSGVNIDSITKYIKMEGSLNATLHGMNGHHTYNLDNWAFGSHSNVVCITITVAAIAQVALNFVLIGNFPPMPHSVNPVTWMMQTYGVFDEAFAWTIIGDGALGIIPPGASISIIGSH